MITQNTAAKIWGCYQHIEAGKKLLAHLSEKTEDMHDTYAPRLNLQLGVPSGENPHQIYEVHPDIALSIIRAHIANKEAELIRYNEAARVEAQSDQCTT